MRKPILFFSLMFLLCGCVFVSQSINEQQLDVIKTGMSKAEVINELGKPVETKKVLIAKEEYEAWIYPIERKWAKRFEAMGDYYYEVLFLQDKVYRWDLIKAYAQPTYDYDEPDSSDKDVTEIKILKNN